MRYTIEIKPTKSFIPDSERKQMSKWKASQTKSKWGDVCLHNELMNSAFMLLIGRVKRLYSGSNTEVYERDHRSKSEFNLSTMVVLITPDLYLELECEHVHCRCQVLYDIDRCRFKTQIRVWLKEYPFSIASKDKPCEGGPAAYLDRVKAFQGSTHFHTL